MLYSIELRGPFIDWVAKITEKSVRAKSLRRQVAHPFQFSQRRPAKSPKDVFLCAFAPLRESFQIEPPRCLIFLLIPQCFNRIQSRSLLRRIITKKYSRYCT